MQHCMCNVVFEVLEADLHGGLDLGREMVHAFDAVEQLIAFLQKRSKGGVTHQEPPITLTFVVGGGEFSGLHNYLLIVIVVDVWGGQ